MSSNSSLQHSFVPRLPSLLPFNYIFVLCSHPDRTLTSLSSPLLESLHVSSYPYTLSRRRFVILVCKKTMHLSSRLRRSRAGELCQGCDCADCFNDGTHEEVRHPPAYHDAIRAVEWLDAERS
jgi:hypothetical protein